MEPLPTLARRFWNAIEPLHAVVYFAPEPAEAAKRVGLKGWWMGYFAGRVAPLGPVGPEAVTAMAFGFAPWMVHRAIPDAWSLARPDEVLATRIEACRATLARELGERSGRQVGELNDLLAAALDACRFDGRPLAAAWQGVPVPTDDPLAALWLRTTVLREHRGDGHVLTAVSLGLRGLDAMVTHVATGAITREMSETARGWTPDEWEASVRRLQARGLLDRDGRLTKSGGALRRELETTTDRLAAAPVERLGETGVERVIELAAPLARRVFDSGLIRVPNPIGVPRP